MARSRRIRLTQTQRRAISMLANGLSMEHVAGECGVARSTVWRWSRNPLFAEALEEARDYLADMGRGALFGLASPAIAALNEAMLTGSESARLRAACAILREAAIARDRADMLRARRQLNQEAAEPLAPAMAPISE